jgi:hypothetical protein
MSKKFTPIVIAKHEQKEKDFQMSVDTKKKRFNELFDYMTTFIDTQDKESLKGKFTMPSFKDSQTSITLLTHH